MLNKGFLGVFSVIFTIILLISTVLAPLSVRAENIPWNTGWGYSSEGSADNNDSDIHTWRGRSSTLTKKLDALGDDIVEDLPMPILFGIKPSNLTKNFGDPRSGGRTHEGLDIMAPKGAQVVSPTDAVVIHKGYGASSGNYVYTANPGGETFAYMHLNVIAEIDEGDVLKPGDIIGYVGNTGNAAGGATHLHFEVREGKATDPYPRLTKEFDLEDKIKFLAQIMEDDSDADAEKLANYVVANYKTEIVAAKNEDIELPKLVQEVLASGPSIASVVGSAPKISVDLTLGSRGAAVTELQKFLIAKNVGSASKELASATATGYFGSITERALAEYQKSEGIAPAAGYYGPITRAHIAAAV